MQTFTTVKTQFSTCKMAYQEYLQQKSCLKEGGL